MITPAYVRQMARYNAWQNAQIAEAIESLDEDALLRNWGAYFGSILGTLNHLLWGDTMWMSRWYPAVSRPERGISESIEGPATAAEWRAARVATDGHISDWAAGLDEAALAGDLTWFSGATGREQRQPLALCVAHFFNHQTHHRGQVHAMLTAGNHGAPISDLIFMPEDAGWP